MNPSTTTAFTPIARKSAHSGWAGAARLTGWCGWRICAGLGALFAAACLSYSAAAEEVQALSLADAVAAALRNHTSVAIASNQVQQAEAALTAARAEYWPQLSSNWQYTFTDTRGGRRFATLGGIPVSVGGSQERHQSALVASYTFYDSGLRDAGARGAHASLDQAALGLDLTRAELSYRVATDYLNLLREQRSVELAQERVRQAQAHLDLVEARIKAGMVARVDRYPLEAELAQAQLSLVTAQNRLRQASITLHNTMGGVGGPLLQAHEPSAAPDAAHLPSLEAILGAATSLRPDLRQAQAAIRSAQASLEQSRIAARPLLSVGTSYSWKVEPAPSGRDLVVDAQVAFPIFDAGARRAQVSAGLASLDSARLRLTQLQRDVAAQAAQARLAATTAWERINAAAVGVNAARRSLESAEARYQSGLAIAIEITDAQVSYYNAQLEAAAARYDYFAALAALRNAVGLPIGDFDDLVETTLLQP